MIVMKHENINCREDIVRRLRRDRERHEGADTDHDVPLRELRHEAADEIEYLRRSFWGKPPADKGG